MRNWDTRDESGTDRGCEWEKDWEDVQRVCGMLDIPCKLVSACLLAAPSTDVLQVDLSRDYWNRVFEPSLCQWEMGTTPNPDVWCNKYGTLLWSWIYTDARVREIKFGALLERLPDDPHTQEKPWFATGMLLRP